MTELPECCRISRARRKEIERLTAEVSALKKDQGDWRKGVELIASSLGESDPPNLSCVRIARIALKLRATLEDIVSGSPTPGPEEAGEDVFGLPAKCVKFGCRDGGELIATCIDCGASYGPARDDSRECQHPMYTQNEPPYMQPDWVCVECGEKKRDTADSSQEHHCVQHGWYADRPCIHCAFADSRGT